MYRKQNAKQTKHFATVGSAILDADTDDVIEFLNWGAPSSWVLDPVVEKASPVQKWVKAHIKKAKVGSNEKFKQNRYGTPGSSKAQRPRHEAQTKARTKANCKGWRGTCSA